MYTVSCSVFVLRNRVSIFGILLSESDSAVTLSKGVAPRVFLVFLQRYDVEHYNIHAIQRLLLRLASFNSSTVNFSCHFAQWGAFCEVSVVVFLWNFRMYVPRT
jgi:hypothetical protein